VKINPEAQFYYYSKKRKAALELLESRMKEEKRFNQSLMRVASNQSISNDDIKDRLNSGDRQFREFRNNQATFQPSKFLANDSSQ